MTIVRGSSTLLLCMVPVLTLGAFSVTSGTTLGFASALALAAGATIVGLALLTVAEDASLLPLERLVLAFGLGLGAVASVAFVLAWVGALRSMPAALLGACALGVTLWRVRRRLRVPSVAVLAGTDRALLALIVLVLAAAAPFVAAPETTWDATWRHLPLARAFAETGSLAVLPHIEASASGWLLPQVAYAVAMIGGGLESAKYLHALVGFASAVAVFAVGGRLGGRTAGLVASLLWVTLPQVFAQLGRAYVDLFPSLYAALVMLGALVWQRSRQPSSAIVSGALAGLALAMKITAAFVVVPVIVLAAIWTRDGRERRTVALAATLALVVAAPGYVRMAAITGIAGVPQPDSGGSPIGPPGPATAAASSILDALLVPLRLVVAPTPYCYTSRPCLGILPPLLLLAALIGLASPDRRVRGVGVVALFGVVMWSLNASDARYLLPTFAASIALLARPVASVFERLPVLLRSGALVGSSFAVMLLVFVGAGGTDRVPWRVALGLESRESYVRSALRFPVLYDAIVRHARVAPRGILHVGWVEASAVYSPAPLWMAESTFAGRRVLDASSDADRLARLEDGGFDYVIVADVASDDPRAPFVWFARANLVRVHVSGDLEIFALPAR